jgi:hypothetical protein
MSADVLIAPGRSLTTVARLRLYLRQKLNIVPEFGSAAVRKR